MSEVVEPASQLSEEYNTVLAVAREVACDVKYLARRRTEQLNLEGVRGNGDSGFGHARLIVWPG
ncbi:hypothetical protein I546_6959 [Mycobacterium kansasii 732]|uniref:Uncharacterized protein n=1 Tax=Mycobacterium kansasii TaxID=1768 RepID=A0A1V3XSC2_MYCKA|nr:hypothetical protein I546_6959 [Mycobacterium kansasii 732]KEP43579.1 hypothetical protein MKSMC1_13570 [Mycobacterium kansasii]OOK82095.1 hypothetical protein BZL30_1481 [Mycobacterium kansasii]